MSKKPPEMKVVSKPQETQEQKQEREEEELFQQFLGMPISSIEKLMEVVQRFMDILRGVRDVKGRLAPLMEPSGIALETSAILPPAQAQAQAINFSLAELFPSFLKDLIIPAKHRNLSSISNNGIGREHAIQLMGAYGGGELLKQLGISVSPSELTRKRAEKKGWFK